MIFDAPLLLFIAPVVALIAGLWLFVAHRKRVRPSAPGGWGAGHRCSWVW